MTLKIYHGQKHLETRRVLVLSTAHLTPDLLQLMDTMHSSTWPIEGSRLPYGYYVYVHYEFDYGEPEWDSLFDCLVFSKLMGFDYVQFDGDADPIQDLHMYEHE